MMLRNVNVNVTYCLVDDWNKHCLSEVSEHTKNFVLWKIICKLVSAGKDKN